MIYRIKHYIIVMKPEIKTKPLKMKVNITLDEDVVRQIKELSEKDERSFSQYINKVLKGHINEINDL